MSETKAERKARAEAVYRAVYEPACSKLNAAKAAYDVVCNSAWKTYWAACRAIDEAPEERGMSEKSDVPYQVHEDARLIVSDRDGLVEVIRRGRGTSDQQLAVDVRGWIAEWLPSPLSSRSPWSDGWNDAIRQAVRSLGLAPDIREIRRNG